MLDFERDLMGIRSNYFSELDISDDLIQQYADIYEQLPQKGRVVYAYLPRETKNKIVEMIKAMSDIPQIQQLVNDYYAGAGAAVQMFESTENDNGKANIEKKMRKVAAELYNKLGNIIVKSMLRIKRESNKNNENISAHKYSGTIDLLTAVARFFRGQGNEAQHIHENINGELSKQAKKDFIAKQKDKGHEQ